MRPRGPGNEDGMGSKGPLNRAKALGTRLDFTITAQWVIH